MNNEDMEKQDVTPETPESETQEPTPAEEKPETKETAVKEGETQEEQGGAEPEPEQVKAEVKKAKPQKAPKKQAKNLKLFKLIYYPVLALFVALMFIFSAIDGAVGYSPSAYGDAYYTAVNGHIKAISSLPRSALDETTGNNDVNEGGARSAREYIADALVSGGFTLVEEEKRVRDDNNPDDTDPITTITKYATEQAGGKKLPTVTLQTSTLDGDLQSSLGLTKILAGTTVTNIVAAIPSQKAGAGAIVITVRYDSRSDSDEAANAAFVANVLQTMIELKGAAFDNDIVAVFTEDYDMSYGAYAFFNRFKGFDGVVERGKVGVNVEAYGNAGTLALVDAGGAAFDYIYDYTKTAGTILNASVVQDAISDELINKHAVRAFGDIPSIQVAVIGGGTAAQSPLDNADNLSQAIVKQQAAFLADYVDYFGNVTEAYDKGGDGNYAYFSYLDGGSVVYNDVTSYVVGVLILVLLAGVVVAMILKKTFSVKNMFKAAGLQLLVVLTTLIAMYAAYFAVTLMLTGFGVLPIHAITTLRYLNGGIMLAAVLITVAASFGFTTLFKKLFRVTSSDCVRGTAVLIALVGAVMSFATPAFSYMTSWLGLLMLGTLLATVLLHRPFKEKFGFGMDRLYLFAVPVAFCLPLVMPSVVAASYLLPLAVMPLLMTVITAMLGVCVPYLDRTQPLLDKLAKKLPERTIRVERTVTEKVEDRAKKGKFTEKTYRKVVKEKTPVGYKNYFGISVVTVLAVVIALFSGGFGVSFQKTFTNYQTYENAIYNDSLVYELDYGTSSTPSQKIVIGDLMAYKFMRYELDNLEWDGERYVKSVSYNVSNITAPRMEKLSSESGEYTYRINPFDGAHAAIRITIPSARYITKLTIKEDYKSEDDEYEGYVYEFQNVGEIVLDLPAGIDSSFTVTAEGASISQIKYEEKIERQDMDILLGFVDDWNAVRGNADMPGLRGIMVIKSTLSA